MIKDRHDRGLDIDNSRVKQITSSIFSLDTETDNYIIKAMLNDCSQEHCYNKRKHLLFTNQ